MLSEGEISLPINYYRDAFTRLLKYKEKDNIAKNKHLICCIYFESHGYGHIDLFFFCIEKFFIKNSLIY